MHTPGPWYVADDGFIYSNFGGLTVADPRCMKPTADHMPEMDANARLIAAAPELLNVLQCMVDDCVHCDGQGEVRLEAEDGTPGAFVPCPDCSVARKVIAKAKGE